jgi:hypothetical protein
MRHLVIAVLALVALAAALSSGRRAPSATIARPQAPRPAPVAAPPVPDKAVRQQLYAPRVEEVRDAEERLLPEFQSLPPRDLLARMVEGPDRKSFNLMLIALENGMRSERRGEYEASLVWAMERTSGNGIKFEGVAGLAARLGVSGDAAAAAARLLMKCDLETAGAEALGDLAARADRETRDDVRRYARERSLAPTLGGLVEDESHVRELAAMLSIEETRAAAEQALARAHERATDPALRASIGALLGR